MTKEQILIAKEKAELAKMNFKHGFITLEEAKKILAGFIQEGGLDTIDAGDLKRARELEAMGFLQITLAVREKINWTAGFAVIK